MAIKILFSIILTASFAYILWLQFSGTLVLGMNKIGDVLFWIVIALLFILNIWVITRISSKQTVAILLACLVIGAAAPYVLSAKRVNTMITRDSRRYVDDRK
jgi:hypothetical protein